MGCRFPLPISHTSRHTLIIGEAMRCVLCRSLEVAMVIPPLSYDYGRESLAICERCNQILHGRSRDYFRRPYVVYALINPFKTDGGGIFYIGKAKNRYGSRKGNIR